MTPNGDDRYVVGALTRGLAVLRCFDRDHPSLSLGEIARLLGWNRTEPFRFLHTLEFVGYLRRDPVTKRYSLTPKVLEFGFAALAHMQLPELAQPYLDGLRDRANGSAHLGILDGAEVVYIARSAARSVWGTMITVGSRLPAHATAMGKTLLAAQDARSLAEWLRGRELVRYTEHTLAEQRAFLAEVAQIRRRGFGISNQEFEFGLRSVAAPIRGERGETVAAINVTAPAATFSERALETDVIPAVLETAAELSAAYGWRRTDSAGGVGA